MAEQSGRNESPETPRKAVPRAVVATLSVATAIAVGVLAFTVVAGGSGDAPHTEAKKMCAVGVLARGGC